MDPKQYAEQAKAEAIAKGASAEQAAEVATKAEAEAKAIMEHPLYKGIVKVNADIAGRESKHKEQIAELSSKAEKLKEIEDKGKTEAEKLASELEALRPKAKRAEALEAEIAAVLESELEGVDDSVKAIVRGSTPEEKLAHVREMKKAGIIAGNANPDRSPGAEKAGKAGKNVMKRAEWERLSPLKQNEFINKGGTLTD
jgi:hypothetical protein